MTSGTPHLGQYPNPIAIYASPIYTAICSPLGSSPRGCEYELGHPERQRVRGQAPVPRDREDPRSPRHGQGFPDIEPAMPRRAQALRRPARPVLPAAASTSS